MGKAEALAVTSRIAARLALERKSKHLRLWGRKAIVVGGAGSVGEIACSRLREQGAYVYSIDKKLSNTAHHSIQMNYKKGTWPELVAEAKKKIDHVTPDTEMDLVFCAAGGFAMGRLGEHGGLVTLDQMYHANVVTAFYATHLASAYLGSHGMLVLMGAQGVVEPNYAMPAYSVAKGAVHTLMTMLKQDPSLEGRWPAICVLPAMLDTVQNRASAPPDADTSTWTPRGEIVDKVIEWIADPLTRPEHGDMVHVNTANGETTWTVNGKPLPQPGKQAAKTVSEREESVGEDTPDPIASKPKAASATGVETVV